MGKEHSDKELRAATQVAYTDFNKIIENLPENKDYNNMSNIDYSYSIEDLIIAGAEQGANTSRIGEYKDGKIVLAKDIPEEVLEWKIVDYYDNNRNGNQVNGEDTGFYGCLIDTGEDDAVVAFRGSEDATNYKNLVSDWLKSDFHLLISTETIQHKDVENFLSQMKENNKLDDYTSISATGHSLGGNLTYHFAVLLANDENEELFGKLHKAVSFDGPCMCKEYNQLHEEEIKKLSGKVEHYRFSLVSGCLAEEEFEGVEPIYLESTAEGTFSFATRHDTQYLIYDENGQAIRSAEQKPDPMAQYVQLLTGGLDHMPPEVGEALILVFDYAVEDMIEPNQSDGSLQLTPEGINMIATIVSNPVLTMATIKTVVGVLVIPVVYELGYQAIEQIQYVVDQVIVVINTNIQLTIEQIQEIKDYIDARWNEFKNSFNLKVNAGYQYAATNPEISVNTDRLRELAGRLNTVNSTISEIDKNLNSLYWKVGFLDLLDILQADLLTGYSWRLNRAEGYLNDTADEFEAAENNIKNSFE